jgi:hypothetical protein
MTLLDELTGARPSARHDAPLEIRKRRLCTMVDFSVENFSQNQSSISA